MNVKDFNIIRVPVENNKLLEKTLEFINSSIEVKTMWKVINVNAIDRLGLTDHGPVHFQIVANSALRLLRILAKNNVKSSVVVDFGLSQHHGEIIVFLASLFHDLGMTINRVGHEEYSLFMANTILREMLDFLPIEERTIVISETLHAILNHRRVGRPITIEGGIVRVADALDMSQGRSRIPFQSGKVDIHSVSAYAIDKVEILEGVDIPISITIHMNNSAGLYQIDTLLKAKLKDSGIEKYVVIKAIVAGETEKKIIQEYIVQ